MPVETPHDPEKPAIRKQVTQLRVHAAGRTRVSYIRRSCRPLLQPVPQLVRGATRSQSFPDKS